MSYARNMTLRPVELPNGRLIQPEGLASDVEADDVQHLVDAGLLTLTDDEPVAAKSDGKEQT